MPIKVQNDLPATKVLESENIFVMPEQRATTQDIRPLRIVIVNLMPTKVVTETQLLRLLGNSPLQVEVELLKMATHKSKHTSEEHLTKFYRTFDDIKEERYDGMIVTGAPVELLEYEEVDYWDELCGIFDWAKKHVYSTLFICWGAQAGLYHRYGIQKYTLPKKLSGIYNHKIMNNKHPMTRGFDDYFLVCSKNGREFYVFGHCEYDYDTLAKEYYRDVAKGLKPDIPYNYFPDNNVNRKPVMTWRSHASLLYQNWLNYYLYQQTPYDLEDLKKMYE